MPEYILVVKDRKPGEPDPAVLDGNIVGEIVRCKDCQYYSTKPDSHGDRCDKIHWSRDDDWFCADGKRGNRDA